MTVDGNTLYFTYDASGTPQTVTYNGTTYYYATNLQGDITAILDNTGTTVVSYTYDAWGNHTSGNNGTGTLASTLGRHNPLRYRGYVFDVESGLYYVSSRYYDPEVGRWVNADSLIGVDDITGDNLFTYCDNNSVNKVDFTGEDGQYIELGNGWYCRIDAQDTSTGTQRHIHIWNEHTGASYSQNEDGSPHDKNNNHKGKLPKWLQKTIKNKTGWDYNGNRKSFFEQTEPIFWVEGTEYVFSDGTSVFRRFNLLEGTPCSIDSYEDIYFQTKSASNTAYSTPQTFFLPIIGPVSVPAFSFGFGWGSLPIPLFF